MDKEQSLPHSIKILHVDDDPIQLNLVSEFFDLFEPSFETITTTSPKEAIKLLKNEYFDCVISDYNMPQMNGIEFAIEVRNKFNTPIILYTGQGSEEIAERAFEVGIDDYFRKEIDPSHYRLLIKRIKSVVEKNHTDELYSNVVEDTRDAICILIDDEIIYTNKAMYHLLNLKKTYNFYDKKIEDFITDEEKTVFKKWISKEIRSDKTNLRVFRFIKKNKTLDVEISKSNINWHGRRAKILFLRDITYRKLIEIEKEVSQERFRSLVEMAPDGIMSFDSFGYVTFLNKAFCDLTGFTKEELMGKHMTSLKTLRKKDLIKYIKYFASVLQGKIPPPLEFTYYRKDGSTGAGESHLSLVDVAGKKEMLLIARDITERKKQEKQYKILFESAPDGIIEINFDGAIQTVNQVILDLTNSYEHELIGQNLLNLNFISDQTKNRLKRMFNKLKNNDKIKPYEFEIINKNMEKIWVETHASPILIEDELIGIQLIIRDISERKYEEEEKRKYSEKLESLVQERTNQIINNERLVAAGQIASMIGHDIRNPLQTIKNTIYLLKISKSYNEKYLNIIEDQISLSIKLLEEFKEQTKITPLQLEFININEVMDKALIPIKIKKDIKIKKNYTNDIINIKIDEFKIRRVLDNILKNAVEAMHEGGTLTIDTYVKNNYLEISITDTGVGIPDEILKNMFKPFQTTKKDGIGLGMLFCKKTVEEHGGTIKIKTKVNEGTTVKIILPIVSEPIDTKIRI